MRRSIAGLAQSFEERATFGSAFILRGVLEGDAPLGEVAVGLGPDPGAGDGGGDLDPGRGVAGLQRDIAPRFPLTVALGVDLQREGRGRRTVMLHQHGALREAGQ